MGMRNYGSFKTLDPRYNFQLEEAIGAGDKQTAEHLFRYWAAWQLAKSDLHTPLILELGCGAGYGARILLEAEPEHLWAVDADEKALDASRGLIADADLTFLRGDLDLPWEDSPLQTLKELKFDLITCMECFELLRHREIFLEKVVEHLHMDGVFMLSSHIGDIGSKSFVSVPSDACIHYSQPLLKRVLGRYFEKVQSLAESTSPLLSKMAIHYNELVASHAEDTKTAAYKLGEELLICTLPLH